jgi:O-antigen ligase
VIFAVPAKGVGSYAHEGSWQGVFGHKNALGQIMLLGAIVFWVVSPRTQAARNWAWVGIVLCLLMVLFSQSRTAWIIAAFLLISIPFLRFVQRSDSPIEVQIRLLLIGLSCGFIAILVIEYLNEILALLGRDTTLTGRTDIWAKSIEVGLDRFWFGHGYRSFWTGLFFNYGHGHNSFLDIWLELGLVGLALFVVTLTAFTIRAIRHLINLQSSFGLWYIMLSIYILLFSMTSQVIPVHGTVTWALYVAVLLHLSDEPREAFQPGGSRMVPQDGLRV